MIFGSLIVALLWMAFKHMIGIDSMKEGGQSGWAGDSAKSFAESAYTSEADSEPPTMSPEVAANVAKLLADRTEMKQAVQGCFQAVGGDETGLDLEGLQKLCDQVEETLGVPASAFGDLHDCFVRFDFNG